MSSKQIQCAPPAPEPECEEEISDSCSSDGDLKEKLGNLGGCVESSDEESCDDGHGVGNEMYVNSEVKQKQIGAETPGAPAATPAPVAAAPAAAPAAADKAKQLSVAEKKAKKKQQKAELVAAMSSGQAMLKQKYDKQRVTRTYRVELRGSLKELQNNAALSVWKMAADKSYIFQKDRKQTLRTDENNSKVGDIAKAVIESFTIKMIDSDFPCDIAVSADQIESNTFMADGSAMLFSVNAGEQVRPEHGIAVYDSSEALENQHMKKYGHLTLEDVDETYTPYVGGTHYLVRVNSPIVDLMQVNKQYFGNELDSAMVIEDRDDDTAMIKLKIKTVNYLRNQLGSMLKSLPHSDMSKFALNFRRTDGKAWNDTKNLQTMSSSPEALNAAINEVHSLKLEFTMSHVLTTLDK